MAKVWLEVALNGPWTRANQPLMPISVEEIAGEAIAAAAAGASIVHFHVYDVATGRQKDDAALYAAVIERVREVDEEVILYGTLPFAGSPGTSDALGPAERFQAVEELARRRLIDWSVVDPGTTNITRDDWIAEGRMGFTYLNPESHVRHGLDLCGRYGLHPSYAIYEPGFLRQGAALHRAFPATPKAIYRFMFSDRLTFGFPPELYALDAYLNLLAEEVPGADWMVAGLDVDIRPLIAPTVARGGHVRVGLEDAPFGYERGNLAQIEAAAKAIAAAGGSLASATEVRAALA